QLPCQSCHWIQGTAAQADIGPNLTHLASRQTIATGVLDNTPENLATWLRNPQAVKPGNHMPDLNLSDAQINELVAYLETLK
ncbi:MAG TPA: cytochrome c, partial [Anaerolineales bacterium]|nr:cytochrome c [Anaerolineales bacterium]